MMNNWFFETRRIHWNLIKSVMINVCILFDLLTYKAPCIRGQLKCDGTRSETRFLFSAKRTSPFKSEGASVQSTTGSRGVRISGSNAGYTMFRGSVKSTGYPLHSPVSPSLPLPCVTVCHHISTGLYIRQSPYVYGSQSQWGPGFPLFRIVACFGERT